MKKYFLVSVLIWIAFSSMISPTQPFLKSFGLSPPVRSLSDQLDDVTGPQFHVMYVLPSDGYDEALDTSGRISASVSAIQDWFRTHSEGQELVFDTAKGELDVSFVRLDISDSDLKAMEAYVVTKIEREITSKGEFNDADKKYAVYYGGGSTYACGGAAWPPTVQGKYAAMYLKARPPAYSTPCSDFSLAQEGEDAGYWEHAMLHDMMHTLGAVPTCAKSFTPNYPAHVGDSRLDLMYSGTEVWRPTLIDLNNDDYYRHSNKECFDLYESKYLRPISNDSSEAGQTTSLEMSSFATQASTDASTDGFLALLVIVALLRRNSLKRSYANVE